MFYLVLLIRLEQEVLKEINSLIISYSTISFGAISISEIIKLWNTLSRKYLGYNIIRFVFLQEMFMLLLAVIYG